MKSSRAVAGLSITRISKVMSLDSLALLVEIELNFNISISNDEAGKINTVQDLVDSVFSKVSGYRKSDIERLVVGIISTSAGIPVSEIRLEHSIVNDLGID